MQIRKATSNDASFICDIIRDSIEQLCIEDHRNDPIILTQWFANKTQENVRTWIKAPDNLILVVEENNIVLGIGGCQSAGEITLNYVAPSARFRGVSKLLLQALESSLKEKGLKQISLYSTRTAYKFYHSSGYVDHGEPDLWAGMSSQPMIKLI